MNNLSSDPTPYRITILVLPESSMMCIASVVEPFRAANRVSGKDLYRWKFTSFSGAAVTMTCGLTCQVDEQFEIKGSGDLLVVVAGFKQHQHVDSINLSKLRKAVSGYSKVAGVEAGTWLLARAGLLNGLAATTHWEDFEAFSTAFPEVDVKLDRYVIDGNIMTSGGASPAFDMFFDLLQEHQGVAITQEAASVFIYERSSSSFDAQPLLSIGRLAVREPRIAQAIRLMEKWIEQPLPVAAIAKRVGVSSVTLETIFKRHVGMTPGRFYLNLRLKAAHRLVLDSALSMREIAVRSGFNSLSAFSRAFSDNFGKSPTAVRTNSR